MNLEDATLDDIMTEVEARYPGKGMIVIQTDYDLMIGSTCKDEALQQLIKSLAIIAEIEWVRGE